MKLGSASPNWLMARASSTRSWLWHQPFIPPQLTPSMSLPKNDLVSGLPKFKYQKGAPLSLICYTQNRSIIHRRFNKTPYELINGRKPDISFLHVFGALCYPKNDREDIGKLGAKGDIGFFIGYSADSCAYRVYNRRTKKIMETMNVSFDELSAMAFEQSSSKPGLQSMTSGQISSGLDLTYAPSTITTQKPTEGDLDLLFEAMYDDFIGGQPTSLQNCTRCLKHSSSSDSTELQQQQTLTPTPNIASSQATDLSNTSQDVDELEIQEHVQHQTATIADNVPNAMFDANTFVNPFATLSTSDVESSSSQFMIPIVEPKYVKEAMTTHACLESNSKRASTVQRLDVMVLVSSPEERVREVNLKVSSNADHPSQSTKLTKAYMVKASTKHGTMNCQRTLQNQFLQGTLDPTYDYKTFVDDILVVHSTYDIIFGSTNPRSALAKPTEKHLKEVKRIFRYLRGTVNTGLWYTKDSGIELTGFSDADYAGCKDTFKSHSVELNS
ncbi:retrovirus-related pol polyprotein from transposon TNT 1-94 [Tanacetum coccineum]|uniref:Retrovirus-related pol polyprotein from transposon TNT 1-94 n=1 Tax=Tanacetum coccineum TaxID=301880 RepID=A0ABQ5G6J9_9ASTR